MTHGYWLVSLLAACAIGEAAPNPPNDPLVDGTLRGPDPEVRKSTGPLDLPAVPAFDLPPPAADGSHSVRELRVKGKKLLDTELTVKGFVTWAYDCPTAIRRPGMTDKAVQKIIDDDPTVCERPKFYVGDTASTPAEKSIWVVDVPRPFNKLELARIKLPDRKDIPGRCEPNEKDPKRRICPPYKVGDQIVVVGGWKTWSPHSERNSDGLIVYARMTNVTQRWSSPAGAGSSVTTTASPPITVPTPAMPPTPVASRPVVVKPPVGAKVRQSVLDASQQAAREGTIAYGSKQWDTAIDRYGKAVERWHDNHSAWYGLAAAYAQKHDWAQAAEAAGNAVVLVPDVAMYQLMYGRTLYEKAIAQAREDQGRKENRKPEEVDVDVSAINFEKPLQHLEQAVKLNPDLWRAHYLIGTIYRNVGKAKAAAEQFSRALVSGTTEAAPWIALAELYRAWDYTDQAIKVAEQGTSVIPGDSERSELWFEVGMGYDDKRLDDKAIEAFTKALDGRRDHHKARFARGQAYFRKADFANAKRDLEDFSKSAGGSLELYRQQASRMLMDIAAKKK